MQSNSPSTDRPTLSARILDQIEWLGNRLPDPALLFVVGLLITWILSAFLSTVTFREIDPRSSQPIIIANQLSPKAFVVFLSSMVRTFIQFPPLGLVIVALLGVGVAEHTGFIAASLRGLLQLTPRGCLTPMLLMVSILSHSAGDSGYVLIIPLGGVMFAAAGRHPLLGITTAFAGVSGGFSANILPSSLDPLLQGFTEKSAQILDASYTVNPLCNWGFMSASCVLIVLVGWYVSDVLIEPRLQRLPFSMAEGTGAAFDSLGVRQRYGLWAGFGVAAIGIALLIAAAWPHNSPLRTADHDLIGRDAPLMQSIVPLIFLLFLLPGIAYGYVAGTITSHRDIVAGMTKAMESISYYLVMAFFAAQFTYAFTESNLGVLLAVKGANQLRAWQLPPALLVLGLIGLTALVDLVIGSASAKWALLAPIFVPMLMSLGLSPELTQCAYRVGDSSINIVTPLMPYFPLVVVYAQRYVKQAGIGTLVSLMLPYSLAFLTTWSLLLLIYWTAGWPLGLQAPYTYP